MTDKPRYLMGVGKPSDLVGAVARSGSIVFCVQGAQGKRRGPVIKTRLDVTCPAMPDDKPPYLMGVGMLLTSCNIIKSVCALILKRHIYAVSCGYV